MAVHGTKNKTINMIIAIYDTIAKTMNMIMAVHETINRQNHKCDYGRPWDEELRP